MINPFFLNNGPFNYSEIVKLLNVDINKKDFDQKITDIKDLVTSKENEITFFHSKKYKDYAKNTKASFCITTESLKADLPKNCTPLVVDNVLVSTSIVTAKFNLFPRQATKAGEEKLVSCSGKSASGINS